MLLQSNLPKLFNASGLTIYPFIFMVNKDDKALVAHETVHLNEQARCWVLPWWGMYLLSPSFRQAAEVRAYKAQIAAGANPLVCALWLANNYRLNITLDQALELLTAPGA